MEYLDWMALKMWKFENLQYYTMVFTGDYSISTTIDDDPYAFG